MGCVSLLSLLLHSAGLFSVTVSSQTTLTLEAEPGDNVTLWYQHSMKEPAYVFWFKHTDTSVPDLLTCLYYKLYSSPSPCHFVPQSNQMEMYVDPKMTFLIVTDVDHTDSGLYYCCIQRSTYMTFSNATFLQVREFNETFFGNRLKASCSSGVFIMLTVVFSAVIVVLVVALLLVLKCRKQYRDDAGPKEQKEEQDGDLVNYAALQFTNKKNKRPGRHSEDPRVIYSSVRH